MTKLAPTASGIRIDFDGVEVAALADLAAQLGAVLDGGVPDHGTDPIRDRLFPRAYVDPTEDRAEADFQSVVHDDLVDTKAGGDRHARRRPGRRADAAGRHEVELDGPGVERWVGALNDIRLAVGVSLGITEEDHDVPPPTTRARRASTTYDWLTWLQGNLVEVLLEDSMSPNPTPGPVHVIDGYGLGEAPADGSVLDWPTVVDWLAPVAQLLGHDGAGRRPPACDAGLGALDRRRAVVLHRPGVGEGPQPRRTRRRSSSTSRAATRSASSRARPEGGSG